MLPTLLPGTASRPHSSLASLLAVSKKLSFDCNIEDDKPYQKWGNKLISFGKKIQKNIDP